MAAQRAPRKRRPLTGLFRKATLMLVLLSFASSPCSSSPHPASLRRLQLQAGAGAGAGAGGATRPLTSSGSPHHRHYREARADPAGFRLGRRLAQSPFDEVFSYAETAAAEGSADAASQGASAPPPPTAEERAAGEACAAVQRAKTNSCTAEIDVASIHFPSGSSEPPTEEQEQRATDALRSGGLPTRGCCSAMRASLEAKCGCNRVFQQVRARVQAADSALTVAYLQGLNRIIALACGVSNPTCT